MNDKLKWINSIQELVDKYDVFIFDCDGVIYQENTPFETTVNSINILSRMGKKTIFLTNNSSKTRSDLSKKFQKMKIENYDISLIYNAGYILSRYLEKFHSDLKTFYVIGKEGLFNELALVGIKSYGLEDAMKPSSLDYLNNNPIKINDDIQGVICGFDDQINYHKLVYACTVIDKTKNFFGTNIDRNVRVPGYLLPGTNSFILGLESGSNVKATIVSKPDKFSLALLKEDLKFSDDKRIIMIGDSLETDVQFAENCGIDSLLLFTGVTDINDYKNQRINDFHNLPKPTYLMENFTF